MKLKVGFSLDTPHKFCSRLSGKNKDVVYGDCTLQRFKSKRAVAQRVWIDIIQLSDAIHKNLKMIALANNVNVVPEIRPVRGIGLSEVLDPS